MTYQKSFLYLAILLCIVHLSQAEWINGLNMPVHNWDGDFGKSYDQGWFRDAFTKYKNSGANMVRIWIYYDTVQQSSIIYNWDGYFNPPTIQFLNDISDCLRLANEQGLQIIFSLFSFQCAEQEKCRNMITDPNKSVPFINDALGPILDHINNQGLSHIVYAIETFNEPEFMILTDMVNGPQNRSISNDVKISLSQVQQFVTKANQVIKAKGFKATVGSVSLKYSCNCGDGCAGNYWGNTGITFYSVHFYSWMVQYGKRYDPYSTRPSDWCLDKPALIEESPDFADKCLQGTIEVKHQFFLAKQNGWIGNMPWADNGGGEWSQYNNIHTGLQCIKDMNSCRPPFATTTIPEE